MFAQLIMKGTIDYALLNNIEAFLTCVRNIVRCGLLGKGTRVADLQK